MLWCVWFVLSLPSLTENEYPERQIPQPHCRIRRDASLKQNVCMLFHPPNIHPGSVWTRCKNKWVLKYRSYIQIITAQFHSPHNCSIIWKQAIWWHDKYKTSNSDCTDIHCSVAINTPNLHQRKLCACINNTWTRQLWGLLLAKHLLPSSSETSGKDMLPQLSFRCVWRRRNSNCNCGAIWGRECLETWTIPVSNHITLGFLFFMGMNWWRWRESAKFFTGTWEWRLSLPCPVTALRAWQHNHCVAFLSCYGCFSLLVLGISSLSALVWFSLKWIMHCVHCTSLGKISHGNATTV